MFNIEGFVFLMDDGHLQRLFIDPDILRDYKFRDDSGSCSTALLT